MTAARRRSPPTATAATPTTSRLRPTWRPPACATASATCGANPRRRWARWQVRSTCCTSTAPIASRPARDDIRDWGARVAPGGTLLIHDSFSSIGVTLAIAVELLLSDRWRYAGRSRSLAEYERVTTPLRPGRRVVNVARQLAQLPWFARNVAIKTAIVLKRDELALRLGHRAGDAWPY